MRDKSSSAEHRRFRWRRVQIGWPIECLPVTAAIVHPRKLTALEWAVLRVVEAFEGDMPSLDEVADELGLAEPAFLRDTLAEVVRLGALEPRAAGDGTEDLANLAFTASGRELFRRGQIEGAPAEHGLKFYFDALTDEDVPAAPDLQQRTDIPFPQPETPIEARDYVGLDRARAIIQRFHEDLIRGDGQVRSVERKQGAAASILWRPVTIDVVLTSDGQLCPVAAGMSEAAQRVLAESDLDDRIVPRQGITAHWRMQPQRREPMDHGNWRARVSRTLAVDDGDAEALRLLGDARREVLLHAGWFGRPGVSDRVEGLVRSGVSVVVFGQPETSVQRLQEKPVRGLLTHVASAASPDLAVVVDGRSGLQVHGVELRVAGQCVSVELAGLLTEDMCAEVRQRYLAIADEALAVEAAFRRSTPPDLVISRRLEDIERAVFDDPELRRRIARVMLFGRRADLEACNGWVCATSPGIERVVALARVAGVAAATFTDVDERELYAEAVAAWKALLEQLPRHREFTGLLAQVAPPSSSAADFVRTVLETPELANLASMLGARATAERLVEVRAIADNRWGHGACRGAADFERACRYLLWGEGAVAAPLAMRCEVAPKLLDGGELRSWAEAMLQRSPAPQSTDEFVGWARDVAPLANVVADQLATVATDHVRHLLARDDGAAADLLRGALALSCPQASLVALVFEGRTLRNVGPALQVLDDAGLSLDTPEFRTEFHRLLPEPTILPSIAASEGLTAALEVLAEQHGQVRWAAEHWAQRCADAIPPARSSSGLAWWLSELAQLRMLVPDLQSRAERQVQRFAALVWGPRGADPAERGDIETAWQALGLSAAELQKLVREHTNRSAPPTQRSSKKGRKGR